MKYIATALISRLLIFYTFDLQSFIQKDNVNKIYSSFFKSPKSTIDFSLIDTTFLKGL